MPDLHDDMTPPRRIPVPSMAPPLPPRPPTVAAQPEVETSLVYSSPSSAPPLPPRPVGYPLALQTRDNTIPFNPSGTPTQSQPVGFSEKSVQTKRGSCLPATPHRKIFALAFLTLLITIVIIAIAVPVAITKAHKSSVTSSSSSDNGGNPLPASEGGVVIGKPGDIAQFGPNSTDHFLLKTNRSSVVTRLDPIVNPDALGSHVHRVYGSSYFTPNLTTATDAQQNAKCTTTSVQDDKSAYWVAQVYYMYPNGSLVSVPVSYTSVYYFMKAPTGVPIYPFPDNYNIVAGNPLRRYRNDSDPLSLLNTQFVTTLTIISS